MASDISAQLNQSYRSALLAYYLGQYIPNSGNNNLMSYVRTPEDAYEYLLIDPLVSNEVTTSRVAGAISSIQQYIDGISMNMEPGYRTSSLDADDLDAWNGGADQYGVWAGEVALQDYPENYIDPTLRKSKTTYFNDLETALNQNKIDVDTAQAAVLGYLDEFEQVANLEIVSGYLDGRDQAADKYYFLGRSRSEPYQYYWRSLDMGRAINDVIPVDAWSEWLPVDLPLSANVVSKARPVVYNNRLYVVWFERTSVVSGTTVTSGHEATNDHTVTLGCYAAYMKFDGSWSVSQTIGSSSGEDANDSDDLYNSKNVELLSTMVTFDNPGNADSGTLYAAIWCPKGSDASAWPCNEYRINQWFEAVTGAEGLSQYFETFTDDSSGYAGQEVVQYSSYGADPYFITSVKEGDESKSYGGMLQDIELADADDFYIDDSGKGINFKFKCDVNGFAYQYYEKITTAQHSWFSLKLDGINLRIIDSDLQKVGEDVDTLQWVSVLNTDGSSEGLEVARATSGITAVVKGDDLEVKNTNLALVSRGADYLNGDDLYNLEVGYKGAQEGWLTGFFSLQGGNYKFSQIVSRDKWAGDNILYQSAPASTLAPNTVVVSDPASLKAGGEHQYFYGVRITDENGSVVGDCYRSVVVQVAGSTELPGIATVTDAELGTAEFLQFDDASDIAPIRLNTLFAKELINRASVSIDDLLSWDAQTTQEPSLTGGEPVPMDFNGANGVYFWELFFYMPFLVAYRLNQQQQYDDAAAWLHYIFDPSQVERGNGEPDYWSVRPLVDASGVESQAGLADSAVDPDTIALADPVHYQKATFMAYVRNMLDAADADYRLLTNDGLTSAKLRYCQAKDLLGPRPDVQLADQWAPCALGDVAAYTSVALRKFEAGVDERAGLFPGRNHQGAGITDCGCFTSPLNTQFLGYWNTLDARLYNLRHNLTIGGQPMNVPLYGAPVNPTVLMQQAAQSGSLSTANAGLSAVIPPYRFSTMLQSARVATSTLAQFGQTLLSYYERGDSASLQELQQQQMLDISSFTISLQQQNIDALNADQAALEASRAIAQQRYDHYKPLYDTPVSSGETTSMNDRTAAAALTTAAAPLLMMAGGMNMVPNIFGLADGGSRWGGLVGASGAALQLSGQSLETEAERLQTSEAYSRRAEEWKIQWQQAQSEVDAINKQLEALAVRQQAAQTSLQMAQAEQANYQATLNFVKTRFTRSSLYNWLSGQLSALYYQAYDAVLSLCLSTQACWQYELGDSTETFIQTSAWNDSYHGMLVGETLALNLISMESAWLTRNQRRLEVTKTISLAKTLELDIATLATTGFIDFTLSEALFDGDYPGHFMRQLKFVTVSLPTLVGPYQDVRATLTQSSSYIVTKADIAAVNYLNDPDAQGASGVNVLPNLRATQQVAISSGLNDSGLFALSFGDERYLPFEGTGAVSSWRLSFPRYTSAEQQAILSALNDVIVQVHYTAIYGGSSFEAAVEATLPV